VDKMRKCLVEEDRLKKDMLHIHMSMLLNILGGFKTSSDMKQKALSYSISGMFGSNRGTLFSFFYAFLCDCILSIYSIYHLKNLFSKFGKQINCFLMTRGIIVPISKCHWNIA
jgi:hypothetical protein